MLVRFLISLFALVLSGPVAAQSPRTITELSSGWAFRYGDAPDAVTTAAFDDSAWEQVSVPHTWNRVGEYALTRSPATNNKQGIGWYRLNYDAKPMAKGRRLYIDFAAVGNIADVWINGAHVGQHKGAFTRFRFDVTPQWKPGAKNLIVVRADNSKPAVGSTTEHVIPLAGDFFIHGGMYRGVQLIEANDVGIDLLDFGGPGVYVRTTDPGKMSGILRTATVEIATVIRRAYKSPKSQRIRIDLRDPSGKIVVANLSARIVQHPQVPGEIRPAPVCGYYEGGMHLYRVCGKPERVEPTSWTSTAVATIELLDPKRWDGTDDPSLYLATINVYQGRRLIDSVTQSFGIRDFKFDPDTGLTLNGKPLKVKGVSRHQDRLGRGWALSAKDHAEDMAIMKEMGVNSVRHAHYPHADEWVEEADKAGMIVWAEVPYVTTHSLSGGEGSAEIFANAETQTRELIRQQYNHPSIAMWSVGNEVDAGRLFGVSKEPAPALKLLQHIAKIAREEDPSRPTIFADCCEDVRSPVAGLEGQVQGEQLAGAADMIGYNRYYGWYYPQPLKAAEQLAAQMDKFHIKHPTLPISISEYGAGGAFSQHSDNVMSGFINAVGRPQPEEYLSWLHEQSWPVIRDRPYIFGSWVWNMFDFSSDLRNEGDSVDINTKGLVSFDRKVKKDAFYYYQAQWSDTPVVHITGKRYRDRAYAHMDIRAYSNADKLRLMIDGKDLGQVECIDRICIWPNVALKPGANQVAVRGNVNTAEIGDSVIWNGPDPAKDGIRLDAGDIAGRILDRHCEPFDCLAGAQDKLRLCRSEAIQSPTPISLDCRASLAMTKRGGLSNTRRFGSDTFVTGGTPKVLNQGGLGGKRSGALKTVTAPDPALYDYWREGEAFSYAIPVPDGKWTVTVHSFDPYPDKSPAGSMTIEANGKIAVPAFTSRTAAGGALKGIAKSFPVTVRDGMLILDFAAAGGKAVVAAIEVTK